jgi:glycolate oxidase FAD binding subunit
MSIMVTHRTPNSTGFEAMIEPACDVSMLLRERVLAAIADKTPMNIMGSDSKAFYGRPLQGQPLEVAQHRGIISYEPTELVITARCGTRLADIEAVLAERGQMLAFEPPHFGPNATLGGAVATGLSGPRRPYTGAVRDVVLGVKLLNGHGEILKFGGEVMKNVAGFDVSRLMVGALGTLGVVLDISMKVLPRPEAETTLLFAMSFDAALVQMNRWAGQNWPLSAACFDGEAVRIRLSGAQAAIAKAQQKLGGDALPDDEATSFWEDVREQRLAFFQSEATLWRLSLAAATAQPNLSGTWFIDWGGALRWLKTDQPAETIFQTAHASGGHACRFRSPLGGEFQPLSPGLEKLHRNIKQVFDPHGIFNVGRLYEGW